MFRDKIPVNIILGIVGQIIVYHCTDSFHIQTYNQSLRHFSDLTMGVFSECALTSACHISRHHHWGGAFLEAGQGLLPVVLAAVAVHGRRPDPDPVEHVGNKVARVLPRHEHQHQVPPVKLVPE